MKKRENVTDEEIVKLFWQRDERAIAQTDKKYGKMLTSIAIGILHDREDAEECLNDVCLALWNAIPPNKPAPFSAYACRIMRYHALNRYREKTRKRRVPSEFTACIEDLENALGSTDTPEQALSAKELGALIDRYLDTLNERQRYIFIGRFCMGDTLAAIAEQLGLNVSTVQRETEKIKSGLKTYLERNGEYV